MSNWLGTYELDGLIRDGSEGAVHSARDTRDGQRVAVKIVKMFTPSTRRRCFEEAALVRECKHPNVIQFRAHAINTAENSSALIMDLAERDYLDVINERGSAFKTSQILEEFHQIVTAVDYIHSLGIAHLDIKPENILVVGGVLKLADFSFGVRSADLRQCVQACGTPGYVAPEMYVAFPYIRPKLADIYSLGIVLYVITQQALPYFGYAREQLAYAAVNVPISFVRVIEPSLESLILDMTYVDPNCRPGTTEILFRLCSLINT